MHESMPSIESESRASSETLRALYRDRVREWREQHMQPLELPTEVLGIYPRFIQEEVITQLNRITHSFSALKKQENDNPMRFNYEKQQFAINEAARLYDERYRDHLTHLTNKAYAKEFLRYTIYEAAAGDAPHGYNHIARITIDLNGLKAVNDLSGEGHAAGDAYLTAVGDWLHGSFVLHDLESKGFAIKKSREGGDEFSLTITGNPDDETIDESFWRELVDRLHAELSLLDVRNLLTAEQAHDYIADAPGTFTFRATAGIGFATLEQSIMHNANAKKNIITLDDAGDRIVDKLTGGMLDAADASMLEDKYREKEKLQHGDAEDTTLALLLSRTEEQRILEQENIRLRESLARFKNS